MAMCEALKITRRQRQQKRYRDRHKTHKRRWGHNWKLDKKLLLLEKILICKICGRKRLE